MSRDCSINLVSSRTLIVDDNTRALEILAAILMGFGVGAIARAASSSEAKLELQRQVFDIVFVDANMPGVNGFDLVEWIRCQNREAVRMVPVIIITAHTPRRLVGRARDCGANYVIAKPLAPRVVLDRLIWVSESSRPFVECEAYVGPDRRWKNEGPPEFEPEGRRRSDKPASVGQFQGENLTQEELGALFAPQKVRA